MEGFAQVSHMPSERAMGLSNLDLVASPRRGANTKYALKQATTASRIVSGNRRLLPPRQINLARESSRTGVSSTPKRAQRSVTAGVAKIE